MANTSTTAPSKAANQTQEAAQKANAGAASEFAAFAQSAQAATGDVTHVPDSVEEIAAQGTALGLAGDHTTGGFNDPLSNPGRDANSAPKMTRVWAMDSDHTTDNRGGFDPLKPDCSVEASSR